MNFQKHIKSLSIKDILSFLILIAFIAAPFYRGLYFRENYIPAMALLSILFIISSIADKSFRTSNHLNYIDITFFAFSLSYFISFVFGISKSDSLDGALKAATYFLIFRLVSILSINKSARNIIINSFAITGFFAALFSMLGAAEIVKLHGTFGFGERLMGLYQYPNATASVLGGLFLVNIVLLLKAERFYAKTAYLISASTIILAFLETKSRGGILALALAWLAAELLVRGKDRLYLLLYSAAATGLAITFYNPVFNSFLTKNGFVRLYIIFILLSIIASAVIFAFSKLVHRLTDKTTTYIFGGIITVGITLVLVVINYTVPLEISQPSQARNYEIYEVKPLNKYVLDVQAEGLGNQSGLEVTINSVDKMKARTTLNTVQYDANNEKDKKITFDTLESTEYITLDIMGVDSNTGIKVISAKLYDSKLNSLAKNIRLKYALLPDDIAKKINEINIKTENSSERLVFLKDGIKMFKDYFLFGTGAKGWANLYTKYQSYSYVSAEAHNFYIQTAIETGIIGFLSMVITLLLSLYAAFRVFRLKNDDVINIVAVASMLIMIFGHAIIDFELSYFAVALIAWSGIAVISAIASQNNIMTLKYKNIRHINNTLIVCSILVCFVSINMYMGLVESKKAAKLINTDVASAKTNYEKALKKSYYNYDYLIDYSQIIIAEAEKSKNKNAIDKVYNNFKEIEKNDPYKIKYYQVILSFYLKYGYLDDAKQVIERIIDVKPLDPKNYELKANIYHDIMNQLNGLKNYGEAKKYAEDILNIQKQYEIAQDNSIEKFELTQRTRSIITVATSRKTQLEDRVKAQK